MRFFSGRSFGVLLAAVVFCLCSRPKLARAGDPYLEWWTITTPHFRVHYHAGIEAVAQRAASMAEHIHEHLVPQLGWAPGSRTEIVLRDDSDSANGFAYALPYNSITLFVTAPEDMSPLGEYDDWLLELITHEYTHILHIDNASGLPALVNAVLGRVVVPNQNQPHWILEGLAVAMESGHTQGGRLRSSFFDMYLRMDVLGNHFASLDEISNSPRRWPGGDLWYLYGSRFIEWILDTYGPDTFARVATEYGKFIIPWGINRAIRRATGHTYPELYAAWKATLDERYRAQADAIRARGLREGTRLTSGGRIAFHPRFLPQRCSSSGEDELVFYRDDATERSGFYRVRAQPGHEDSLAIMTRASGSVASPLADCSLVFDAVAPSRRQHAFSDLFYLPAGLRAENGMDRRRQRLTTGLRAREPDVSPDGRHVVFVTNDGGTTTLRIADLAADGEIANARHLVASARFEQAYTPRFSPDGARVAYSAWTSGGYRDVRVVDLASGHFFEIAHDRALDQQPTFSPDGRTLYFTSDRSGVANVYAYDFADGGLHQVTNVLGGAYMPEVSPDGRRLVYVGYTERGFDLFAMALDRARWLPARPAPARVDARMPLPPHVWPAERYNPLPSLRPRAFQIDAGTGTFGDSVVLGTRGADAVGHHAFNAALTLSTRASAWNASLNYTYSRLPFDLSASFFRDVAARGDYRIGERPQTVMERMIGLTTGIGWTVPGEFDVENVAFSFTVLDYRHDAPLGTGLDPWSPLPYEPSSGTLASPHLSYFYTNAEGSLYGLGAERGFTLAMSADFAHPSFGSDSTLAAFSGHLVGYLRMPWHPHHVLALAASGGSSGGTFARRGLFATGGFVSERPIDVYTSIVRQSGFVLRGFEPLTFVGNNYTLFNSEYRFPIAYVDRGVSTLPVFLEQLSGTVFADYGGAYNRIDHEHPLDVLHLGVGGELWIRLLLGYRVDTTLRFGVAHGFGDQAASGLQTYFVGGAVF